MGTVAGGVDAVTGTIKSQISGVVSRARGSRKVLSKAAEGRAEARETRDCSQARREKGGAEDGRQTKSRARTAVGRKSVAKKRRAIKKTGQRKR